MRFFKVLIFVSVFLFPLMGQTSVSTLVADTKSGLILSSKNSQIQQYPASLTKVMTLYMTFSAIDKGILKMDDRLPVSLKAARQPRSKLYVKAGQTISVRDAIMALIIISANDVAVVLAEALAPSEAEFAQMMTQTAHSLGLKSTTFKNASGLHNPDQVTTAQDMAVLAMAMIHHFPHHYKLFSKRTFSYKGRTYRSHNHVQKKYKGAEGLKTGYISAVGYNIISTAKRNNNRLVSVVIGQDTVALRDRQAMNLLDRGFSRIKKHKSSQKSNVLNKKALLEKPDMTPLFIVMAKRLDNILKSNKHLNRSKLLALNPFSSKPAHAAENETSKETLIAKNTLEEQKIENSLIDQGSNIKAEEAFEQEDKINYQNQPEEQDVKNEIPSNEIIQNSLTPQVVEPTNVISSTSTPSSESVESKTLEPSVQEKLPQTEKAQQVVINQLTPKDTALEIEKPSGWGIQVGAFKTKEAAIQQAERATRILKIRNKQILTPQSLDYYRSRIYGFYSKKAAQNVCRKLKQKKMGCLVVSKEK